MKNIILLIGFLCISMSVNAAMFKCTDAEGRVSFSDKPCPDQQQETIKERTVSTPDVTDTEQPEGEAAATAEPEADTPSQAEPKQVTNDSPLAIAYLNFLNAMKQCNRGEMLKYGSGKIVNDLARTSDEDLKKQCTLLQDLMPANFDGATEVFNGDKATIEWRSESISTDEQGPSTLKSLYSVNFSQEGGVWKYGD